MLRRAMLHAFCIAAGTSRLALPMPTRAVAVADDRGERREAHDAPFHHLRTRLILIIFSRRPSPRSSACCLFRRRSSAALAMSSRTEAAGGRRGERLHAP